MNRADLCYQEGHHSGPGFPFLHILANTSLYLFDNSHSDRCKVADHCGFNSHFLMVSDAEHFFTYLLTTCIHLLWKNAYSGLLSGFKMDCFPAIELYEFLIRLRRSVPYRGMVCKYSLPFYRLPFCSDDCFFCCIEDYLFDVVPHVDFFAFVACAFSVISKKPLPRSMLRSSFPVFSGRSFTISGLTFKPLVHFKLTFFFLSVPGLH